MRLLPILLHHSEPADPTLLHWIRERIDAVLGLGPAPLFELMNPTLNHLVEHISQSKLT